MEPKSLPRRSCEAREAEEERQNASEDRPKRSREAPMRLLRDIVRNAAPARGAICLRKPRKKPEGPRGAVRKHCIDINRKLLLIKNPDAARCPTP